MEEKVKNIRLNRNVFTKCFVSIILLGGIFLPELSAQSLADGLKGYWRFESPSWSGAENEAVDSSSCGNHGTPNNFGQYNTVTGKIGQAASFDGQSRFIKINNPKNDLDITGDVTLTAWVYLNAKPAGAMIPLISGRGAETVEPYELAIMDDSIRVTFALTGGTYAACWAPVTIPTGQWFYVAMTKNGRNVLLYMNGSQIAPYNTPLSTATTVASGNGKMIGGGFYGAPIYLNGMIDEVAIWSRALSAAEITQLYNEGKGMVITVGSK